MFKRFTNACVRVVNRWLPDAFLFAVILTTASAWSASWPKKWARRVPTVDYPLLIASCLPGFCDLARRSLRLHPLTLVTEGGTEIGEVTYLPPSPRPSSAPHEPDHGGRHPLPDVLCQLCHAP